MQGIKMHRQKNTDKAETGIPQGTDNMGKESLTHYNKILKT